MNVVIALVISIVVGIAYLRMRRMPSEQAPKSRLLRGRVDDMTGPMVWYEAENPLQIPHVRGAWDRRMAKFEAEGRMFTVPGDANCTTWDDLDAWTRLSRDLETRSHYLRIEHNHWRHDMDNDAIVLEFASSADFETFLGRVAEHAPQGYDHAAALGVEGKRRLETLPEANRPRTATEARHAA